MNVQLLVRQVQDGMPRWMPSTMTRTNSLGEFRFAELLPGAYKVMTQELMDTDPETVEPRSKPYGFPPKCFPGVPDFASGSTIQLAAGQRFQADIPLTRQRYFPVNIPVVNAENIPGMNVSVSAQAHPGPGYSLGYNPGTRRIEGLLPSGHYSVEGHTHGPVEASGEVNIAITGAEVQQPTMVLVPGIHDEGASRVVGNRDGTTDDRGAYELGPLIPGTYYVSVRGEPWYAVHPPEKAERGATAQPMQVDPALDVAYPVSYYGDTGDADSATPIHVRGGERVEADVHLAPVPALHLLFRVPDGGTNGTLMPQLWQSGFDEDIGLPGVSQRMVSPGVWELSGVPQGKL